MKAMGKDKFSLFLEQNNFKDPILQKATLKKVVVNKTKKCWTFFVEFDNSPSLKSLKLFVEMLNIYFVDKPIVDKVDYFISFNNQTLLDNEIIEYYKWLLKGLIEKQSSHCVYETYKTEFIDGKIVLHIDKQSVKTAKIKKLMDPLLKKHGLDVEVELKVDETLSTSGDKLQQKKSKALTEMPVYQRRIEKGESQTVATRTRRRGGTGKVEPISAIPKTNRDLDIYLNTSNDKYITIEGVIVEVEVRALKSSHLLQMIIADKDDAIIVKQFLNRETDVIEANKYEVDYLVKVSGEINYDTFIKDVVIMASSIETIEKIDKKVRRDTAKEKRVEFHLHTQMSNLDGIGKVRDYIDQAIDWGHEAIAFTDHEGLYAFPEIAKYSLGKDIKPIYGVELEYIDEEQFKLAFHDQDIELRKATYVVFDLETTGLSYTRDKIIEISAVKIENMNIVDQFNAFVNPEQKLSEFTIELTSITDEMLAAARTIEEVLPEFLEFIEGSILVAHNVKFDLGFLYEKTRSLGLEEKEYPAIDTINIARYFYSNQIKRFNLKSVARLFQVKLEQHHRAEHDARATGEIFLRMLVDLYKKDVVLHSDLNKLIDLNEAWKCGFTNHIVVLAQNQEGYKNLFKLVSETLTNYYYDGPRLTKGTLNKYRKGLLVGSACYKGDVFEKALYDTDEELEKAMKMFDYIEVQPPAAYEHLVYDLGEDGKFIIESVIRKIVLTAQKLNKLVIATGDVHYLDEEDAQYREIYINARLVGGGLHDLARYKKSPIVPFLTTDEMLERFSFLGEKTAYEIVVDNTKALNSKIEKIEAFPERLYSLSDDVFEEGLGIESIKQVVEEMVYENAHKWYGKQLHPIVEKRIEKELKVIIDNEYAPIYYISYLLVKRSKEDGYLVGSRGSVGSSFVATLMEITEVNPLKPHYRCKNGCITIFAEDQKEMNGYELSSVEKDFQKYFDGVYSGYDLPKKPCPICNETLIKDGQDIPFETFLGFTGEKIPDIDLNFSGDYQSKAHSYVRELVGEQYAFRAGTIQTVAERNAIGYVKGYLEKQEIEDVREARIKYLAKRIEGVKRSTGQHPGGIVVVPNHKEIFDVTPVQYPANDTSADWYTTHFDYHSFEANLLKLDVLGHDDPTVLKFLMDYVEKHPNEFPFSKAEDIPLDDKKVYGLFNSPKSINLTEQQLETSVPSYGLPEFGTPFVRGMLEQTKPNTFAGLVKISGLSHGTDVWLSNARDLIAGDTEFPKVSFEEIIGCRDDIMVDLMTFGMSAAKAFEIMEFVRRGSPYKNKTRWEEYQAEMRRNNVPEWYIWSCGQIKYMFPKAHAAAYVLMAVRIAWFKVHKPIIFYSSFFSIRATQFEHDTMVSGINGIRNRIKEIEKKTPNQQTEKEANLLITLQVAYEMHLRGFKFLPVDIHKSSATRFEIENGNALRMPFASMDGLGVQVATDIVESRNEKPFKTVKDVNERTKINKTVFENMSKCGAFDDLIEEEDILEQGLFAL